MSDPQAHERVNDILLGPLERPLLRWLAAHMPPWVTPDVLTAVGVGGALIVLVGYVLSNFNAVFLWFASLGFVVNWLGDSLDGTLARHRHIERPRYGYFVDHTVDSFNELLIVIGLGLSPYVRLDIAGLALAGYFLMSILVFIRTYVSGVFQISYGKLGPTEVRVILILLNALMFFAGARSFTTALGTFTPYDVVIGVVAAVLIVLYVVNTLREARALATLESTSIPLGRQVHGSS